MNLLFSIIWFIGVMVALPRLIASFYEIDERYIHTIKPSPAYVEIFFSLFSWLAVLAGIMVYYYKNEKYFWKWNKKELWAKYYKYQDDFYAE